MAQFVPHRRQAGRDTTNIVIPRDLFCLKHITDVPRARAPEKPGHNVVNMSQPGVCIGGGLHALIHIFGVIHMPGLACEYERVSLYQGGKQDLRNAGLLVAMWLLLGN